MIFGLMLISSALEVVSIGLILPFIALFTAENPLQKWPVLGVLADYVGVSDRGGLILTGCAVLFLVVTVKSAFTFFANVAVYRINWMAQHRLAVELLGRFLHADYVKSSQINSAEIVNLLRQSVGFVYGGFIMPVTVALADAMMILATVVLMLAVEPWGTLAAAVAIGIPGLLLHRFLQPRFEKLGQARERWNTSTLRALNEALGSLKEATVLRKKDFFLQRFAENDRGFNRVYIKSMTLNQIPRAVLETAAVGSVLVVLFVIQRAGGPQEHALAVLAFFAAATLRILPAALRVIQGLNQARYASGGIDLVWSALRDYGSGANRDPKPVADKRQIREITFRNVGFEYPDGTRVLRSANVTLRRGEMIGIVGASGAGKTTLVDILMGLLHPTEGELLADGKKIESLGHEWLAHFGYVPQQVFLIDDTISRNVAFGIADDEIDQEAVSRALTSVNLGEFAANGSARSQTLAGERGGKLSGGQLQRIGIARALYHDADVLILDEPTSALNVELEREFLELIRSMKSDKTIVIISHRERMLEFCDRVFRVENGVVTEGTLETR